MNVKDIIIKIIELPHTFYKLGNVSIYSLLKDTGYFLHFNEIDVKAIGNELKNHQSAIEAWLSWSDNKRVDAGWYFKTDDKGYIVGYLSNGKSSIENYDDEVEACAAFIKHEIEEMRKQK